MRSLFALLAIVVLGTGCSGVRGSLVETGVDNAADGSTSDSRAAELDPSDDDRDNSNNLPALDSEPFAFTAPELFSGRITSGDEFYDDAPLLVTFVSPTCAVCVSEGPEIALAAEANPDITYLIIHGGSDTDSYQDFADTSGLYQENVVHIEDASGFLTRRFSVLSTPTTVLVNREGRISQSVGALEAEGQALVAKLVSGGEA